MLSQHLNKLPGTKDNS